MSRRIAQLLFVLLLSGSVLSLGYLLWPSGWNSYERGSATFDSQEWKAQGNGVSTYRWCAVDDLYARHSLVGMSRQQILDLLGEPSGFWDQPLSMDYVLAPQPLIDSYWLILDLNEAGVVTKVYEQTD